ncbi:hypothetical protein VTN02DRAFT_4575 [Thermoascus thermophilus]
MVFFFFSNWLSIIDSKWISFPSCKHLSDKTFTMLLFNSRHMHRTMHSDSTTQPAKLTPLSTQFEKKKGDEKIIRKSTRLSYEISAIKSIGASSEVKIPIRPISCKWNCPGEPDFHTGVRGFLVFPAAAVLTGGSAALRFLLPPRRSNHPVAESPLSKQNQR